VPRHARKRDIRLPEKEDIVHPTIVDQLAKARQRDRLAEAAEARLAREARGLGSNAGTSGRRAPSAGDRRRMPALLRFLLGS
jgi:hypothetical protein